MNDSNNFVVGFASFGLFLVGLGAAVAAIVASWDSQYVGVGVCLIASALSFGLLLNAVVRK